VFVHGAEDGVPPIDPLFALGAEKFLVLEIGLKCP
jgi:hypothetical protein